jgi:hypothetical protein
LKKIATKVWMWFDAGVDYSNYDTFTGGDPMGGSNL